MKSKMIVVRSLAEKETLIELLGDSYQEVRSNSDGDFFLIECSSEVEMICALTDIPIRTVMWASN